MAKKKKKSGEVIDICWSKVETCLLLGLLKFMQFKSSQTTRKFSNLLKMFKLFFWYKDSVMLHPLQCFFTTETRVLHHNEDKQTIRNPQSINVSFRENEHKHSQWGQFFFQHQRIRTQLWQTESHITIAWQFLSESTADKRLTHQLRAESESAGARCEREGSYQRLGFLEACFLRRWRHESGQQSRPSVCRILWWVVQRAGLLGQTWQFLSVLVWRYRRGGHDQFSLVKEGKK